MAIFKSIDRKIKKAIKLLDSAYKENLEYFLITSHYNDSVTKLVKLVSSINTMSLKDAFKKVFSDNKNICTCAEEALKELRNDK